MPFQFEFIGPLGDQPITAISCDASGLSAPCNIEISQSQEGSSDINTSAATNVLTFGSGLESGDFTLTHPLINSGNPQSININSIEIDLESVTTGISDTPGVSQTYTITWTGTPASGFLYLGYRGYGFLIYANGTSNLNGNSADNVEDGAALITGGYPGGPWTASTNDLTLGTITFTGPQSTYGSSPWSINESYSWFDADSNPITVSGSWTDGSAPITGNPAAHSLALPGAFGGTFTVNSSGSLPWNADHDTMLETWSANVGSLSSFSGSGTAGDPWEFVYYNNGPVSLPTITGTSLVGFTNDFLQTQVGSDFTVSGSYPTYTLTSTTLGSGQSEITTSADTLIAAASYDQPVMVQVGILGSAGAYPTWTLTLSAVPDTNYLILQCGDVSEINVWWNGNANSGGELVQDQLNGYGLGAWTVAYSGGFGGSESGGSITITFTYNTEVALGSNPWSISANYWYWGGGNPVNITPTWTDGFAYAVAQACIQSWVSPAATGATGGTFNLVGSSTTVSDLAWNINITDLCTAWVSATGEYLAYATNPGTVEAPYNFFFYNDEGPIALPSIDESLLTTAGSLSNNFTDGNTTEGQPCIQTITLTNPTGGTWSLSFGEAGISGMMYNISTADVQTSMQDGFSSDITVSGTPPVYIINFNVHSSEDDITGDNSLLTTTPIASIVQLQVGQS